MTTVALPVPEPRFRGTRLTAFVTAQVPEPQCRFQLIRRPSHFRARVFQLNRRLTRFFSAKSQTVCTLLSEESHCRFQLNRRLSHFRVRFFQLNRRLTRLFSAKS